MAFALGVVAVTFGFLSGCSLGLRRKGEAGVPVIAGLCFAALALAAAFWAGRIS